ncbi:MAG: hypothetical protein HC868_06020 [Sphingomonadales bacterium]|nr:hypothetical protein [Sphingomonadales bacterium]
MNTLEGLLDFDSNAAGASRQRVPVLLPVALNQTYDYLVPSHVSAQPGSFVLVPFGPQLRIGIVWDQPVGGPGKTVDPKKLKALLLKIERLNRGRDVAADDAALEQFGPVDKTDWSFAAARGRKRTRQKK